MPFFGINHGQLYSFVYFYSEKILAPIRRVFPIRGRIDWSPFIAVILLNLIKDYLLPVISLLVRGNFIGAVYLTLFMILSLFSSILTFFMIIVIVKIVNDHVNGQYSGLTFFINNLTYKPIRFVKKYLPYNMQKYSAWILLSLIIILKIIVQALIEDLIQYFN